MRLDKLDERQERIREILLRAQRNVLDHVGRNPGDENERDSAFLKSRRIELENEDDDLLFA